MRHIQGVCVGAIAAVFFLGAGCKPNQPVRPQNPSMEQSTGGAPVIQNPDSTDSHMGTGTGGSGLRDDTGSSPYMETHDAGTGDVRGQEPSGTGGAGTTDSGTPQDNTREPAPGTTQGNDSSHRDTDPGVR